MDPFDPLPHPWSAFHSDDYGYTRLHIKNATHLYIEQVSDDKVHIELIYFIKLCDTISENLSDRELLCKL